MGKDRGRSSPAVDRQGQRVRRGKNQGDERSIDFPRLNSGDTQAVIRRGRAGAEFKARSGAAWPRVRSEKGMMMRIFLASAPTDYMLTLCPAAEPTPKAVNFMKTKGRKRHFPPPKAVSLLKISQLQETM